MQTDTLIIGGGLSGLALARKLTTQGGAVLVLEARDRLGGRMLSPMHGDPAAAFDLGPAWFWPGQERMEALVADLGLQAFEQHCNGEQIYEDEAGRVHRGRGHAAMAGSLRIAGGMGHLIAKLAATLPPQIVRTSHRVTRLERSIDGLRVSFDGDRGSGDFACKRAVLALPPRLAAARIDMTGVVPATVLRAWSSVPTWMAGQAKVVAVYDKPIWRAQGLSGDAMSRRGPLVEIHDASPTAGGPYALFGFVGVPPQARTDQDALARATKAQLGRLFGSEAATPSEVLVKDWAQDAFTATADDIAPLMHHPHYGLPQSHTVVCEGRLLLAGSENAPTFGGYLEGALEAADRCAASFALEQENRCRTA